MDKKRIQRIREALDEGSFVNHVSAYEVMNLLDLAEKRLDHLESNRKRVAKRRRKIKREGRK